MQKYMESKEIGSHNWEHSSMQKTEIYERLYVVLSSLFVATLLLTNIIGTKLFVIPVLGFAQAWLGTKLVLTSGILTYPITFLLTDLVSEIWGKKRADFMVFLAFFISFIMLLVIAAAKALPGAEAWQVSSPLAAFFHPQYHIYNEAGELLGARQEAAQAAFSFTFDAPGLLLFSSMLAYLTAQLLDNFLFHFWKRLSQGRHLWLRNNASTWISQLADTFIVNSIFLHFYWGMSWYSSSPDMPVTILQVILGAYGCKVLIAMLDTPLIYLGAYFCKRLLRVRQAK